MSKKFLARWNETIIMSCSVTIEAETEEEALATWNEEGKEELESYHREEVSCEEIDEPEFKEMN